MKILVHVLKLYSTTPTCGQNRLLKFVQAVYEQTPNLIECIKITVVLIL